MLTKQSTLRDLTNKVVVQWFKETISERIKLLRSEVQQLMNQMPMLSQFGNLNNELSQNIDQIKLEISYLKNLNEIKTYTQLHSFNANDALFKNNNFSFENIAQFLNQGESFAKMLIKIQLGESFALINKILEKITVLDAKIGFDEPVNGVLNSDVSYLLNKSMEPLAQELVSFISQNRNDADNVFSEATVVLNNHDWNEKLKNIEIVDRYFSKFKVGTLVNNLLNPENLEKRENQTELLEYSRVLGMVHSLNYFIKLAGELMNSLQVAKNAV